MNEGLTPRLREQQYHFMCPEGLLHHCPIHPFMRQEVKEKGVIPNLASVQELRDEGDLSCTKANALIMACGMVAINICLCITK